MHRGANAKTAGVWNLLGCEVKQASSLKEFKEALKKIIYLSIYSFVHYYCN